MVNPAETLFNQSKTAGNSLTYERNTSSTTCIMMMVLEKHILSSNWKKLQSTSATPQPNSAKQPDSKRKRPTVNTSRYALKRQRVHRSSTVLPDSQRHSHAKEMEATSVQTISHTPRINAGRSDVQIGKYVSLDCEMVGVGVGGVESALARVSIVNWNGDQVYDSFVRPKEEVTDWRTSISGIKPSHMKHARSFEEVQEEVAEILKERVVIGHALRHDFKALLLDHPIRDIRDTSRFAPYRKLTGGTPKLQLLASQLLGLEIQGGEHSSLEDARACMLLFRRDKDGFETKTKMRKRDR